MKLLIPTVLWSTNLGLMLGFTFGVLILLRPITRRLLRPKHHVILWFAGWIMGFTMSLYTTCGWLPLPLTFRGLLMPKGAIPGQPAFLALASDPGQAEVLSRGSLLPLPLSDRAAQILTIIWLVFLWRWWRRGCFRTSGCGRSCSGEPSCPRKACPPTTWCPIRQSISAPVCPPALYGMALLSPSRTSGTSPRSAV